MKKYKFRRASTSAATFTVIVLGIFGLLLLLLYYLGSMNPGLMNSIAAAKSYKCNPVSLIYITPLLGFLSWVDFFEVTEQGILIGQQGQQQPVEWSNITAVELYRADFGMLRARITLDSELASISIPWPINNAKLLMQIVNANTKADNPLRSFLAASARA